MTPEEALGALVRAVEQAQRRGVYSLQEAAYLHSAIGMFTKPPQETTVTTNNDDTDSGDL